MTTGDDTDNLRTSEGRLRKYEDREEMLGARATLRKEFSVTHVEVLLDDTWVGVLVCVVGITDVVGAVVEVGLVIMLVVAGDAVATCVGEICGGRGDATRGGDVEVVVAAGKVGIVTKLGEVAGNVDEGSRGTVSVDRTASSAVVPAAEHVSELSGGHAEGGNPCWSGYKL